MKRFKTITLLSAFVCILFLRPLAQEIQIDRIEPPFWWTGMKNPGLQLLVYGKDIGFTKPRITHQGVTLTRVTRVENDNYLFLDLVINEKEKPVALTLDFIAGDSVILSYPYLLKKRAPGSADRRGFNSSDAIYLLMPDRFANGDATNDTVAGMVEKYNRKNPDGRHGGDLQGVMDHLDYLKAMGITTLWMNPFVENNNPAFSYHGYAITDFYRTDPRFGSNEQLVTLVNACHDKGLKVIMDQILNHASIHHWMMQDPPSTDWVHTFPEYTRSNFRASTIMDPYASQFDQERMLTGWFDVHMPDLNQSDQLLLTYFIQNSIWWIEFAGLDGIRLDTQPYSFKDAVAQWATRIFDEYPFFNIVGEAWMQQEAFTAYFQKDSPNPDGYNSHIPTVTDFPLYYALTQAFNEKEGWSEGMARLYLNKAQDHLYANAFNKLIFCDNHDLSRYYSSIGEDLSKYKMGLTYLLTTIGTPMIYYGTEILKTGFENQGHGMIRTDFPGGWPQDSVNAFEETGRNTAQQEAYTYLQSLLQWRKNKTVIHTGKMTHFVPANGIYVFFRYNQEDTIMVIFNNNESPKSLNTSRFLECTQDRRKGYDPLTGKYFDDISVIDLDPKSAMILELH